MKNVTLKDIARALGISEATVSLALNDKPTVSRKTRQRVLEYVAALDYTPNPLARGLALQRTMTIGLVCPDTENPYYGSFVKHISNYCARYGYSLALSPSNNSEEQEAWVVKSFVERKHDGIIVMPLDARTNSREEFWTFVEREVPFVFCTSYYDGYEQDCVRSDYPDGAYQLTRYLLEHGHRDLWYLVTEDQEIPVSAERLRGYRQAYRDLGIEADPSWVIPCHQVNSTTGYEATRRLLTERPAPDGILALNDYMAFGVMRAVQEAGLAVPDDISVAGYDDVFYARIAGTPLTTVRQDLAEISASCVRLLVERMRKAPLGEDVRRIIPSTLVVRETTREREPSR